MKKSYFGGSGSKDEKDRQGVKDEKNGKDKKGKDIYLYENQCAINMHYCLKNSGVNMDSFKGGICKHGLARGAQELANWLKNLKPFGDKVICNICLYI